ncbi:DUF6600 domain-containing protein [Ramlibacter sp. 2FC]|uniref:DUF6600 domain-containing protein n=1 Tax=Ramlibacter sp. 2FC TaxID=2502188 RepID=UPI0010F89993|nr:DUF6600 domain-containing protein [Ramlibacter sp. 2FC]
MMKPHALTRGCLARMLMALVLALAGAQALAQAGDPPGRVARLNHMEGAVSFLPAGDDEWVDAPRNRPMTRGDQLWTDRGARAELHLGSTAARMDERTQLQFTALDDKLARLSVPQGTLSLRVRRLHAGQQLAVDTPNLRFNVTQPGEYRLDVDPANASTRVTLHSGQGTVYGDSGQALGLTGPQQLSFSGRNLAQLGAPAAPQRDDFDQWAAARDRQEDRSVSARYVSRETTGYQQLDQYGDWRMDPGYGPVWYPYVTVANWAPYRYGHWEYIPPWGWTWIDDAPWGFAPFHYGRWVQISLRWCWVPGPIVVQPVYAPALVAFVASTSGPTHGYIALSSGQPGVAWFPLAPGEAYRPAYRVSRHYIDRVNRHHRLADGDRDRLYRYQRQPDAVTVVPREAFGRSRPMRGEAPPIARAELDRARVVAAPRFAPERRRDEDGIRRAPPERIPPGWEPRQRGMDPRASDRPDARLDRRFGERDEDARRARQMEKERAQREQAMRERSERQQRVEQEQRQQRAMQEQAPRQQQAQQMRQLRERDEHRQREQAERQQRAMQEQAQRQQQRAERIQQMQVERQRPNEEQRRVHGERRQRTEEDDGRR